MATNLLTGWRGEVDNRISKIPAAQLSLAIELHALPKNTAKANAAPRNVAVWPTACSSSDLVVVPLHCACLAVWPVSFFHQPRLSCKEPA